MTRRLLVALLLPLGAIMLATLPWDFRLAAAPSERAYDDALQIEARELLDAVQLVEGQPVLVLDRQAERLLRADAIDHEYFAVHDGSGRLLGGDWLLAAVPASEGDAPRFVDGSLTLESGSEEPVRVAVASRRVGDAVVTAQVAETLARRKAAQLRILAAMVLPNVLVAVVGAMALYGATRLGLAPLEHLAHDVAQRTPDDLRPLQLGDTPAELAPVLASLNRLFERVRRTAHTQQRFHANVAHQLRTPLAGLRTQIELAQSDATAAERDERFHGMLAAVDRLSHLVDQLLTLSRAESGALQAQAFVPVDLAQLIEQRAGGLLDQAARRGIDLGFDLQPVPSIAGNPVLIGEMVANLVDNALRHCPAGSVVTVSCSDAGGHPGLAVEDDGPGIAPPQRAQVFDRFHRGTAPVEEGSGLGLAIVQEIAQLHGATVALTTPAGGRGARFEVTWPQPGFASVRT